jgi:hypothetical protein
MSRNANPAELPQTRTSGADSLPVDQQGRVLAEHLKVVTR